MSDARAGICKLDVVIAQKMSQVRSEVLADKVHARELLAEGCLIELLTVKILGKAHDIAALETVLNPWPGLTNRGGMLQVLVTQSIDLAKTRREGILRLDQDVLNERTCTIQKCYTYNLGVFGEARGINLLSN